MFRIREVILIVLLLILSLGGVASGTAPADFFDSAKTKMIEKRPVKKIDDDPRMMREMTIPPDLSAVPWPNPRCGADNSGYSSRRGPGEYRNSLWEYTSLSMGGYDYHGLLVGKDNWVYFCSRNPSYLYAVKTDDTDEQYFVETGSDKPACLDGEGNIYYIHADGDHLIKEYDLRAFRLFSREIPQTGSRAVEVVGEQVYVSTVTDDDKTFVCTYSHSGDLLWESDEINGKIVGVAEDIRHRLYYVQTTLWLHQFSLTGESTWSHYIGPIDDPPIDLEVGPIPPVVSQDGHVLIYDPRINTGTAFTRHGDYINEIHFTDSERPRSVVTGLYNRLYVLTETQVLCYSSWENLVWSFYPTGTTWRTTYRIHNIVLGGNGMIYAWCRKTYNPSDGPNQKSDVWKTIHPQFGGFMDPWGNTAYGGYDVGAEMAIGISGQLFCLHESGKLVKI